jgi:transglutaminase-like putative cysteine protease
MRYEISHRTTYVYDDVVSASYGQLHQMPSDVDGQRCLERWVVIDPVPDTFHERVDFFGNRAAVFTIHAEHAELVVSSHCTVDTTERPTSFSGFEHLTWEGVRDAVWSAGGRVEDRAARDYALESPMVRAFDAITEYAAPSFAPGRSLHGAVTDLVHRIHTEFTYEPGVTKIDTSLATVMEQRRGVCQDFAHLLLAALRSVGLPSGYVSGYLETAPPPGKARLVGADQTHAWVSVYCGGGRWIGVDPTNDQLAGPRYVTTAYGRDYGDIPPLKGVIYTNAKKNELTVEVDVVPV